MRAQLFPPTAFFSHFNLSLVFFPDAPFRQTPESFASDNYEIRAPWSDLSFPRAKGIVASANDTLRRRKNHDPWTSPGYGELNYV